MKNYFKFNLTGNKLLPVWIVFMVFFLIPYVYVQFKLQGLKDQSANPQEVMNRLSEMLQWYGFMFLLLVVEYFIIFFIAKLAIEAIEFKEKSLTFAGKINGYLSVLVPGFLLSLITLGIYSPWFMVKMINFFARNSSYEGESFEFKGRGGELLVLIILTLLIPIIFVGIAIGISFAIAMKGTGAENPKSILSSIALFTAIVIIIIPFIYNYYKWIVNFSFKNYSIKWKTNFWSSVATILGQVSLSIITFGIYIPLAYLRLFNYFAGKTIARSETSSKKFGYDIEPGDDFLFIWGQLLLTFITLGIYYPWAFCKVLNRVLGKTYSEEIELEKVQ